MFAEIQIVLKPGVVCIITFSSRLVYSKAIQGWRDNSAFGRISLVKQYFQCVEGVLACSNLECRDQLSLDCVVCFDAGFTPAKVVTEVNVSSKPPTVWAALQDRVTKLLSGAVQQDPFYAVVAYKQAVLAYKE